MTGTVVEIKRFKHKTYGFIKADTSYYFNLNDVLGGNVNIGDDVDFEVKGDRAVNVKLSNP